MPTSSDRHSRRTLPTLLWVLGAFVAASLVIAIIVLATGDPDPDPGASVPAAPTTVADTPPSPPRTLHRATITPGPSAHVITAPGGPTITVPPGALTAPAPVDVVIAAIDAPGTRALGFPHVPLGAWDFTVGDQHHFPEAVILALPYDPARLPPGLPAEFALTASYWDATLEAWLDMPSVVDEKAHVQLVPTHHLTAVRQDAVIAAGHVYTDHFSIKFDPAERAELQRRHANFATVFERQPEEVLAALEAARVAYARRGFREMEKIKAVEWGVVPLSTLGVQRPPWAGGDTLWVKSLRYNVYMTGDRHDDSWTWKGIMHSSLNRNKFTGDIHVPWDFSGVQAFELAHEVFHAVQNRYYNLVGLSELGLPGSTSPGHQLLARLWWIEATAEYAAGALAHPRPDGKPHRAMGGDPDLQRLDKALAHSPSAFRPRSERPSYQNAWFFAFLSDALAIDFKELFEDVAARHSPSVLDNLEKALASRAMPLPDVYAGFARWWFLSPDGPILRGCPKCQMPENALAGKAEKRPGQVLRAWSFPGGAGPHRARLWEITVASGTSAQPSPARTPIIAWLDPDFMTSVRVAPPERITTLTLWPAALSAPEPISRPLTPDAPWTLIDAAPGDRIYLLAVRNDDLAGVLGQWHPEVTFSDIGLQLAAERTSDGSLRLSATASRVPSVLGDALRFAWHIDGRDGPVRTGIRRTEARDAWRDTIVGDALVPGPHQARCQVQLGDGRVLAEAMVAFEVAAPPTEPAVVPPATDRVWTRMTLWPDASGWRPLSGNLQTIKGLPAQSLEAYTGVPASDEPAFFAKATLNVSGTIRTDLPVRVWTAPALEAERKGRWARKSETPGLAGGLASGGLKVGLLEGAFVAWRQTQTSTTGWGTSYMWEYEGNVSSGNAQLAVMARVSVDAKRPEDDAAALTRFEALVAQAEGIIGGLKVDLE